MEEKGGICQMLNVENEVSPASETSDVKRLVRCREEARMQTAKQVCQELGCSGLSSMCNENPLACQIIERLDI